jgi:tetratricopeptide (TPR) repeat protein
MYYTGFLTKRETLPFSKAFFSIESSSLVDRAWDLKGTSPLSTKELDQLYQLKLDRGIRNLPIFSSLLIRESEEARQRGNSDQAVRMARYSIKFAPDLSQPYFELADAYWHQNPFQVHKILSETLKGQFAQLRYYPSSIKFFYNMFYILCNAILMTFIIFGIVVLIRYLPLYFYEIRKGLTQEISRLVINSLKIFFLLIPFFLRLDILWAILFWSVLLWGYVTNKERQFILFFLIVLVYLPFFLMSSSSFLNGDASDVILDMNQANYEGWNRSTEERLLAWVSTHPDDSEVLFSLGLIEKRQGRYSQAEEFYQRAIQQNPKFSEAYANLGNTYLAQRQTDLAIASYQQAIDLNPTKGAYYYNLYRAYSQESFLSEKIDEAFRKARQLDPNLVDYYSMIDSPHINRLVVDAVLTPQGLWDRFMTQFIGRQGYLFHFFKAWFEKIPSRVPFLVPILFLGLLIGMSRYSRTKKYLTRCPMCGTPTYRFYLGTSGLEFACFNCHRIFIQKEKLHPKIAEKKSLQARDFQKRNHFVGTFLSFFFVGFDDLWREHLFKGLSSLFLFFIFILRFVHWNGLIGSSITQPDPGLWRISLWGGLFILFYLLSIRRILRLQPRFETEK